MSTFSDNFRGNFDGNGSSLGDLFLFDNFGDNAIWLMDGLGNRVGGGANLPFTGPTWHAKAVTDFNNAGPADSDILWQNDNGTLALWQMQGTTILSQQNLPDPGMGWHANFANDFNNDTGADILFQHDLGNLAIWTLGGSGPPAITGQFNVSQNPGAGWHAVATGDTNGGGAGIVFQHDTGLVAIWENPVFNTTTGQVTFGAQANLQDVGTTWHVKGMGDVNGDARADIILQNDNGAVAVWEMGGPNGTTTIGQFNVTQNPGASWHIAAVRDMNNDGRADLIFQNEDNGAGAIWANFQATGGTAAFMVQENINPNLNPSGHLDWHIV